MKILNKKSFTLIELLVVIAVLAGFMAMLVPNYMQARMKSRDVRRKSDLRGIQKALELYKQNQKLPAYPPSLTFSAALSDSSGTYMQKAPQDPMGSTRSYSYTRGVDTGTYTLCACLENINDTEGIAVCSGGIATCNGTTGIFYQLNEP